MAVRVVRLRPDPAISLGGYDLDAFSIEHDDETQVLDFRFELGAGLSIFWALPAGRGDRLRLAHVDGAAYELEEPVLIADPWICDVSLTWSGELGEISPGRMLVAVVADAAVMPPYYRVELVTRDAGGAQQTTTLAWRKGVSAK